MDRMAERCYMLGIIGNIKSAALQEFNAENPGCRASVCVIQLTSGTGDKTTLGYNIELARAEVEHGQYLTDVLEAIAAEEGAHQRIPRKKQMCISCVDRVGQGGAHLKG